MILKSSNLRSIIISVLNNPAKRMKGSLNRCYSAEEVLGLANTMPQISQRKFPNNWKNKNQDKIKI